ncbi:MAG: helix-turn-helix domain-containing protein [Clostridia bacterium]|nr:helix-turn-helix domain-containing protein [Clostridia bacterium]
MARRSIPVQKRVEIVKRYWAGEPIAFLAREYGLSRETIYRWIRRVEAAMYSVLANRPPLRKDDGR